MPTGWAGAAAGPAVGAGAWPEVSVLAAGGGVAAGRIGVVNLTQWVGSDTVVGHRLRSWRVVSAQVQGFTEVVGRDELLAALRAGFAGPGRVGVGRPVVRVLAGLGGVGKTSVARAYADRYQDGYGLVWWVRAEDPAAVGGEFRALLEILAPDDADQVGDPVQAVQAVLANRAGRWLLVLDNVRGPADLQGLVPAAGDGDVLVTTRAGVWPDRRQVLRVDPLPEPAGVRLLTALSGDDDPAAAAELAEILGGLPLALAQAGAYVAGNALDLRGYLDFYRRSRADMLAEGQAPDYGPTVATTWQLAVEQLAGPARALLNLVAFYAPDAIPLHDLLAADPDQIDLPEPAATALRPVLADELRARRAVAALAAYSLLTHTGPATPAGRSVSVHRLVQAVTADHLTEPASWAAAAAALLSRACPSPPATLASTAAWLRLHTHARTLLTHLEPDDPGALGLRARIADWTGHTGNPGQARDLHRTLAADRLRLSGAEHPETLAARAAAAWCTGLAGDVEQARDLFTELVTDLQRVLGPDHPATLNARGGLARWTGEAGHTDTARQLYAELIDDRGRVLGPDHRATLSARAGLARWTAHAGDAGQARNLHAALVHDRRRLLGPVHWDTLRARAGLAWSTTQAGDTRQARDLFAELVVDMRRGLGPDHRETLRAGAGLAWCTGLAGDLDQADSLGADLLADMLRVLGPDDWDTLGVRAGLAWCTGLAGDPRRARDLFAQLVPDTLRVLGPDHWDTLTARAGLAWWSGLAGDHRRAGDLFTDLIPDLQRLLGPGHRDTLGARAGLAWSSRLAGDAEHARDLFTDLVDDMRRVLGPAHPDTQAARTGLTWASQPAGPGTAHDATDPPPPPGIARWAAKAVFRPQWKPH